MRLPTRSSFAHGAASLGAGALVGASLPPWGWWPLAFPGIAVLDRLVADQQPGVRFRRAALFSAGWLAPGMGWMWFLTAPGYVAAVAMYAALHGAALAIAPAGRWRWLALPAALTMAEAIRFTFPFGGVPLASLAVSQAVGPLAELARVGGALLITWATLLVGVALSLLWTRRVRRSIVAIAPVAVLLAFAIVAPDGTPTGRTIEVALVQGGGPQGTRAIDTNAREVVERHLAATRTLSPGPDLVVWPENVIDVDRFETSVEREEVAAEAERLDAPIIVGITEEAVGRDAFVNAQVVVLPDGTVSSRYEKVRRVPFGEYMPMRGLLRSLGAPVDQVPRDAVAGVGPAYLDTPEGRVAVVISWEVFFGGRARDGVGKGGLLLINPTNGSSYTGTVLQSQQVASSRLRTIETGRWEVQVSPTGFSAFVTPDGDVLQRTGVSERAVRTQEVELRDGSTIYVSIGDRPVIGLAALVLLATVAPLRRPRSARSRGRR
ncbi:MAG: apolipoprotein N-acyltransferase [Acidimicrobiia bacterium]